ncbi:haloacid dehalogenase superfamily enzyme, subfamily IA [Schinkia azotoformans MEV2011]|uniref:Haloacid dehalogenase superfamily enzyme, subfamily IA n=1 Tax=Schinkia azotoformans MEV2011 TaxID=1348973 RepID=A0A072NTU5_SCHAZ|nr:HAD family hydrolase [Schinkia azotoformans]KEF40323.1 haloacid dehalogenase superfamily enzyme, subfamily IA [Schinkia azotoformans MEV2011]MEC1696368.1 HAD family hydrolase [Schinkia azotoformans]MEC1724040.1 HAD family hydrolase [Schinkia azotoformans]
MHKTLIPIFDLDDTLYCEHDYVRSGFKSVANFIASKNHTTDAELIYKSFINVWLSHGRGKVFDIVCENLSIPFDIAKLVQVYREHQPKLELYDDAKEVLSYFNTKKIPMGLITDGNLTMQWRKIKSLKLDKLIDVIIVTDDLGFEYWKPNAAPYKKAAQELNVPIEKCVYIGDNPNKDFVTAKKLGMHTIRIVRPVGDHAKTRLNKTYEADKEMYSLIELLEKWS